MQVLADVSRSSLVPLMHVLATNISSFHPIITRDLCNDHRSMVITESFYQFRTFQCLLGNDTDALTYALFEVTDYLPDMVTVPFSTFGLPTLPEDLAPRHPSKKNEFTYKTLAMKYIPPFQPSTKNAETFLARFLVLFCLVSPL